eukprot:s1165_g9.t1
MWVPYTFERHWFIVIRTCHAFSANSCWVYGADSHIGSPVSPLVCLMVPQTLPRLGPAFHCQRPAHGETNSGTTSSRGPNNRNNNTEKWGRNLSPWF